MKKIILSLLIYIMVVTAAHAQADRVVQTDSIKSGKDSVVFLVNSRHNYNTVFIKDLVTTDTIKVYNINENGFRTPVALRDLNTYTDLESNTIKGLSGNHEFLILHPNIYKLDVKWSRTASLSKRIDMVRRGNNLK